MQDHWVLRLTFRVSNTVTMNEWVNNPLRRYAMGAYYLALARSYVFHRTADRSPRTDQF